MIMILEEGIASKNDGSGKFIKNSIASNCVKSWGNLSSKSNAETRG